MSKSKKKKQPDSSKENRKDSSISTHKARSNGKKQLEAIRNKTKTKANMEFYHPHGNHPNRNFKDYIAEFIMIFIAITGGFFMENMREHVVEHHKEKEYIVRLIRDLKEDTTSLKYHMRWNQEQIENLNSLAKLIEKPGFTKDTNDLKKFFILLADNLNNFEPFITRDITMSQLKSTGGLRFIENSAVSDRIVIYYEDIEYYQRLADVNDKFTSESFAEEMKFIDFNQIEKDLKLCIIDVTKLKELGNRCFVFKIQLGAYNDRLKEIYKHGASLIKYLQKEYKLKDDENKN